MICNKFLYIVIERRDFLFYCGIDIDMLERHDILARWSILQFLDAIFNRLNNTLCYSAKKKKIIHSECPLWLFVFLLQHSLSYSMQSWNSRGSSSRSVILTRGIGTGMGWLHWFGISLSIFTSRRMKITN